MDLHKTKVWHFSWSVKMIPVTMMSFLLYSDTQSSLKTMVQLYPKKYYTQNQGGILKMLKYPTGSWKRKPKTGMRNQQKN